MKATAERQLQKDMQRQISSFDATIITGKFSSIKAIGPYFISVRSPA